MNIPKYVFKDILKDYFPQWNHKGWKFRFYFKGQKTKFFPGDKMHLYNNLAPMDQRKIIAHYPLNDT